MSLSEVIDNAQAEIRLSPHNVINGVAVPLAAAEQAEYEARNVAAVAARPARALAELREQRNALLAASDWTQLPDAPTANAAAWKVYRQALRDLPQQTVYPNTPQWPTAP